MSEPEAGQKWHIPDIVKRTEVLETLIGTYAAAPGTPSNKHMSFHIYRLAAGEVDDQTPHLEDELYYVFSGSRKLIVNEENGTTKAIELNQGDLVYVPAHAKHTFEGPDEIVLMVFFAPNFSGD
ncbi:hypothetical protein RUESEDTHA_00826 [Ruegeria sp. THAF57]|uniref:cupin domain-containing protein n=1 Tax=Ruegeria sp. THAF57 TaxID=2744555 RepID=UPI0015DDA2CB|nr:cupin domain-containing protein [Ruegeria sp. THAF57]CAD0183949.1 hypothetical protein RUESEDTHA_00826 [Ruegeria sp. THAF57]